MYLYYKFSLRPITLYFIYAHFFLQHQFKDVYSKHVCQLFEIATNIGNVNYMLSQKLAETRYDTMLDLNADMNNLMKEQNSEQNLRHGLTNALIKCNKLNMAKF